jgi:hypothetical protein
MSLILTERPANGGLLRISHQSPGYDFGHFLREIANSLRRTFEKLPFLGDRRPETRFDLHCLAELAVQLAQFSALAAGKLGTPSQHCRAGH